jgi:hypothetical protein
MALRKTLGLSDEQDDAAVREHIKKLVVDLFEKTHGDGK